jgi:hypothetical protein
MNTPTNAPAAKIELPEPDYEYPTVTLVVSDQIFPKEPKPSAPPQQQQASCPHCKGPITLPVPEKPSEKEEEKPVYWAFGTPHPFVANIKIVRMHVMHGVVHVFSTNGQACVIDQIPMESVRLIEKGMVFDVFKAELEEADRAAPIVSAYLDDEEEEEEEEEPEPEPEPATNGVQPTAPSSVS